MTHHNLNSFLTLPQVELGLLELHAGRFPDINFTALCDPLKPVVLPDIWNLDNKCNIWFDYDDDVCELTLCQVYGVAPVL